MRRCFYHTDLGQNVVFYNFAIKIVLIQYSGRSKHALPCEQCFLQAGRYVSMMIVSMMIVSMMIVSIEQARPRDDYEYQRQDGNENFNKTISLISKTTTLHVHHALIFAFLCHFCTTTTWRCLILRFMDNVNKQQRNLIFFSLLNLDMVSWNSTPFGFAYIWQNK